MAELHNRFFEISVDLLCITAMDGRMLEVNNTYLNDLGHSSESALGTPFLNAVHSDDREHVIAALVDLASADLPVRFECRYRNNWGQFAWIEWHCISSQQPCPAIFMSGHNISERKQRETDLLTQAHRDSLTGLTSRNQLFTLLQERVIQSREQRLPYSLLFIDLDSFKPINDTFGHALGDLLLQQVAQRLRTAAPTNSELVRYGGDEFVMLVADDSEKKLDALALNILRALAFPFEIDGVACSISASIGIETLSKCSHNADLLLRNADMAMYAAKSAGGNRFTTYQHRSQPRSIPAEPNKLIQQI